jgi:hypothetical protein
LKHEFGTPNPIIIAEERSILSAVDRAIASSPNPQVIGRNGELPFRDFLRRYLPPTLRAETGHFLAPSGKLSPQLDVMVLDARYPLLASNPDGTVLAMLHSVLSVCELKTTLRGRDLKAMWTNAASITALAAEVEEFTFHSFATVRVDAFAYRIGASLPSIEASYIKAGSPDSASLDVYILRVPDAEQPPNGNIGAMLHFEPSWDEEVENPATSEAEVSPPSEWFPTCHLSHTILSDFYYRCVQDSYYSLSNRGWSFGDIGQQVMKYMTWATLSWDSYVSMLASKQSAV